MSLFNLVPSNKNSPDGTGYNEVPVGFREISKEELFDTLFFFEMPEQIEFKQIYPDRITGTEFDEGKVIDVRMFWFHDGTGVGVSGDFSSNDLRLFAFGCNHSYRELTQSQCRKRKFLHYGMCYHVLECKKCGHLEFHDSSD